MEEKKKHNSNNIADNKQGRKLFPSCAHMTHIIVYSRL